MGGVVAERHRGVQVIELPVRAAEPHVAKPVIDARPDVVVVVGAHRRKRAGVPADGPIHANGERLDRPSAGSQRSPAFRWLTNEPYALEFVVPARVKMESIQRSVYMYSEFSASHFVRR